MRYNRLVYSALYFSIDMNTNNAFAKTEGLQNSALQEIEDVGRKIAMIGRQKELVAVIGCLNSDEDIWIVGAPGNGRGSLVYRAAEYIGATVLEIDCMRAKNSETLLEIMWDELQKSSTRVEDDISNLILDIKKKESSEEKKLMLEEAFKKLIKIFQEIAESLNTRIVILFHGFEHIYIWDKSSDDRKWESFLREEIKLQTKVSYVFIGTGYPKLNQNNKKSAKVIALRPLDQDTLEIWVRGFVREKGLNFSTNEESMNKFLEASDGHFGNARTLAKRLILICKLDNKNQEELFIKPEQVQEAIKNLLKDMSPIFESLILSLPDSQLKVLECLAEEHTPQPHKEDYIRKHSLMRGGSLQGALKGLTEKGLIYDTQKDQYDYKLTSPLIALWIKARLTGDKSII
jgi:hypothetical protein